ncbi:alpha-L-fucosidase [Compostibacter hankyongensis]|uniref:alpha-L-fucosidase n=1 Tax=Compostibacter hankyongensis TaxID=1007089 RepID=A0ABP8FJC8_9BACT
MTHNRRHFFKTGALTALGMAMGRMAGGSIPSFTSAPALLPDPGAGPFLPTVESLSGYRYPDWFRDAKFGIWSHWGPQAVPRHGDWYARRMYIEGDDDYKHHLEHYGHPSKFGYKDIIPLWKAQRWEPDQLMALYKKAGAKYFVSMGSHHDNFFLWNSRLHKWNAVNYGPRRDVVGTWQKAARKAGLRFGVSEHLGASFTWFQTSHGADKQGPMKGISYDGANPVYQDLYHGKAAADDHDWLSKNAEWQREWLFCIMELIDNYHPDLLYSDSGFPFGEYGRNMLAHFYNGDLSKNNGTLDAVYTCKQSSDGYWVEDLERGVKDGINPSPWQTDTSIGDWYYRTGQPYKTATDIIRMLVDIVSKNGNLLINVVQTPEGDLEPDVLRIVDDIGKWIAINGEGIYGSRPWKIYGEQPDSAPAIKSGNFNENKVRYDARDIRFTTKGDTRYAFCLGAPETDIRIAAMGSSRNSAGKAIDSVALLGGAEKTHWRQRHDALVIARPSKMPVAQVPVTGFRITFKK